jgi:ATP-dependent DNA ligase
VDHSLIDSEAVVFRDGGKSDFHALLTKRGSAQAAFGAFDLLRLDRHDLRQRRSPRQAPVLRVSGAS